jgi:membrane-associated phospholipid phosphatase
MPRNVKAPLFGAAACTAALALLVYAAYSVGPIEHLDLRIYLRLGFVSYPTFYPAGLLVHLGDLGPLLAFTAMVVGLGIYFGRRREIVAALAVIVGANLTTQLLKVALEHPRHSFHGWIQPYWAHLLPTDRAFPSGHTTAVASIAVALLFVVPARHRMTAAAAGILLTASMVISVIALGWHYPSDALGAMLVSAIWGFLMVAALRLSTRRERVEGRETAPMHGPLVASGD